MLARAKNVFDLTSLSIVDGCNGDLLPSVYFLGSTVQCDVS